MSRDGVQFGQGEFSSRSEVSGQACRESKRRRAGSRRSSAPVREKSGLGYFHMSGKPHRTGTVYAAKKAGETRRIDFHVRGALDSLQRGEVRPVVEKDERQPGVPLWEARPSRDRSSEAGPGAATVLSDFGAEVIKVEPPGIGDPHRITYKIPPNPSATENYGWHLSNRNKYGMAVDLKTPRSREILERLVKWADVLVVNFPQPVRKRLTGHRNRNRAEMAERPASAPRACKKFSSSAPVDDNLAFDRCLEPSFAFRITALTCLTW